MDETPASAFNQTLKPEVTPPGAVVTVNVPVALPVAQAPVHGIA